MDFVALGREGGTDGGTDGGREQTLGKTIIRQRLSVMVTTALELSEDGGPVCVIVDQMISKAGQGRSKSLCCHLGQSDTKFP